MESYDEQHVSPRREGLDARGRRVEYWEPVVSLADVVSVLARRKIAFLACLAAGLVVAIAAAFVVSPSYESETVVTLRKDPLVDLFQAERTGSLGGLLSLGLGKSVNDTDATARYLTVLQSRSFLMPFLGRNGVIDELVPESADDDDSYGRSLRAYREFSEEHLEISRDRFDSIVRIRVTWSDPIKAALIANGLVNALNAETREKYLHEAGEKLDQLTRLIEDSIVTERRSMLFRLAEEEQRKILFAQSSDEFAFEVLDPALAPVDPSFPNFPIFCVVGLLAGGAIGLLLLLLLERRPGP